MNNQVIRIAIFALVAAAMCGAPHATAGPVSAVATFNVCSLLNSGEAGSIMGDPRVVQRGSYGPPGFFCSWTSPATTARHGHDVVIMLFTATTIQQIGGRSLNGVDPVIASAFRSGSPRSVFQALQKQGQRCLGYAGPLPCAEIAERVALYKRTNVSDYVVLVFAQREEGRGDAGIIRLAFDAAHVANRITPRLP